MILETFQRQGVFSRRIFLLIMVLEHIEIMRMNQSMCLPKAELNTKSSIKLYGFFFVFNSIC